MGYTNNSSIHTMSKASVPSGNEDDICKIWAWPFLIYNALLVVSQGILPSASAMPPSHPLSQGFTLFSCLCCSTSQTQTPAAQLVCLTVCQTARILLSSSPASAGESSFTNTSPYSKLFIILLWITFEINSRHECCSYDILCFLRTC